MSQISRLILAIQELTKQIVAQVDEQRETTQALQKGIAALMANTAVMKELVAEERQEVGSTTPVKLVVQFQGGLPGMAATVQEGLLIGASDLEFNAEGDQVAASDPTKLTYAVDDTTVAQVLMTADDPTIPVGQAKIKGLKVGSVNVTSTDTATDPPLVSDPVPLSVTLDPVAKKLVVSLA